MHTTEAGKELHLSVDAKSPLLTFKWKNGGLLPVELQGLFTADYIAQKAFNMWKARKEYEEGDEYIEMGERYKFDESDGEKKLKLANPPFKVQEESFANVTAKPAKAAKAAYDKS